MKVSANFILQEFIDPDIYMLRGDKSVELIDSSIIFIAQFFRDYFGQPIVINNWHDGGEYKESGLRKFLTKTGSAFSQHKFGRAVDMKIQDVDPEEARREIVREWEYFKMSGMTTIESGTPTWLHVDCSFTGIDELLIVPFN
ncbi:MAG: D-Ala-D-Ala carboxypeptidase family metallohydrolase [Bacteroidales bacterium]